MATATESAVPSALRRGDACESIIGLPLRARRPRGAARAARRRAAARPSRRHVRRARDRATRGTADPQVNATAQYWQLYQVTQDGLTAFRKTSGAAANSVVADLAVRLPRTSDGGRTWTLTLAARRALLQRRARAAARRALHVRAAVQGPRPDGRVALRRHRRAPARACRTPRPARSTRHRAERPDDHVPSHAARPRVAAEARAAAGRAAAAERGHVEIGTDVSRLVGTGPYYWASYAPARQLVLSATRTSRSGRRRPSRTATSTASCSASGSAPGRGHPGRARHRPTGSSTTSRPIGCPSCSRRFSSQVHGNQLPADWYVALNVNIPPFNQLAARQAVNLAIDRKAIVKLFGGPQLAAPTCQVLPPGFPGLRPLLPVDARWGGALVGARSGARPQLVAESGTARRPGRHRRRRRRRAEGDRRVHSGGCSKLGYDARLTLLPDGVQSPSCRTRATASERGSRSGSRTTRLRPLCSTACSAATPSCRTPTPAPTSAASATARRSSR